MALIATLYSNPLTIVPLYALAYSLGAWVSGAHGATQSQLNFPEVHWHNWTGELWSWLGTLGKPFLIGLPLMALIFALTGYVVVRVAGGGDYGVARQKASAVCALAVGPPSRVQIYSPRNPRR